MRNMLMLAAALGATVITAAGTAASARPAAAQPTATGTEYFQVVSTSPTLVHASLIASGMLTAAGAFVPTGSGMTAGTATFANGTLKVTYHATSSQQSFDPATCALLVIQDSTFTVAGGTGLYTGISGSGHSVTKIIGITARTSKGACSQTSFVAYQQVVSGKGTIRRCGCHVTKPLPMTRPAIHATVIKHPVKASILN